MLTCGLAGPMAGGEHPCRLLRLAAFAAGLLLFLRGEQGAFAQEIQVGLILKTGSKYVGEPMVFSPDGKTLALLKGRSIQLWDVATGKRRLTVRHSRNYFISALAFSPDGKTLALCSSGDGPLTISGNENVFLPAVRLVDVATGKTREILRADELDHPYCLAWAPDGRTLMVGGEGGRVDIKGIFLLFDFPTRKVRTKIVFPRDTHSSYMRPVFSPDSKLLALGDGDNKVYV